MQPEPVTEAVERRGWALSRARGGRERLWVREWIRASRWTLLRWEMEEEE